MIVECPVPLSSFWTFIVLIPGGEQNKLWSSSLCSLLYSSAALCLFCLRLKYSPQHTQKFHSNIFLSRKMRLCIQNLGVIRPSVFRDITKPMLVIVYRIFHSWMWDRLAVPKSRWRTSNTRRDGSQKSRVLVQSFLFELYFAVCIILQ